MVEFNTLNTLNNHLTLSRRLITQPTELDEH